jgi:hypothetical protein
MTRPTTRGAGSARDAWTALAIAGAAATCFLLGCKEKPAPQAIAPVVRSEAPPPPPPPPAVTPVATLMARLSIDERISLPEEKAPPTDAGRIAVLEFFDAFARGDVTALGTRLDTLDHQELDALAKTTAWRTTIDGINEIALETGKSPQGDDCVLALFDVGGAYQPQLWYYQAKDGEVRFESAPTPPGIMDQLYGTDWIARWHELIEKEQELANKLYDEVEMQKVALEEQGEESAEGEPRGGGGRPGAAPGGGGSPDRRKTPPKRKPPGAR